LKNKQVEEILIILITYNSHLTKYAFSGKKIRYDRNNSNNKIYSVSKIKTKNGNLWQFVLTKSWINVKYLRTFMVFFMCIFDENEKNKRQITH